MLLDHARSIYYHTITKPSCEIGVSFESNRAAPQVLLLPSSLVFTSTCYLLCSIFVPSLHSCSFTGVQGSRIIYSHWLLNHAGTVSNCSMISSPFRLGRLSFVTDEATENLMGEGGNWLTAATTLDAWNVVDSDVIESWIIQWSWGW